MKKNTPFVIKILFLNEGDVHNRKIKIHFSDGGHIFIYPHGVNDYWAVGSQSDQNSMTASQVKVVDKIARRCTKWLNGDSKKPALSRYIKPILKPGWADQRKPEINALRKELIDDITRLLLSTDDEIVVFRDYDEDKVYLDLNVGNKGSDGTYPKVMNVSLSSTKKPCVSLDLGYEEKELLADDLEFSTDDLASIYDAMLWILAHPGEVDE